ncbi:MAG: hypothetical protein HS130_05725 [Deltaproteobacteria bacterium]|nr:hypothetical protein [Deltaproteobacteria bacterium]MCL4873185.1 hypothetical protein [bacterium]
MSISPAFHGWSSGYLKPAFSGWERHDAIAPKMAVGRLVHQGHIISTCAHAGAVALLVQQPCHAFGISPAATSYRIAKDAGRSKAVSSGDDPLKAVCGRTALKISAPPDGAARSIMEARVPPVCNVGDSPSKTVKASGDAYPAVSG